MAWPNGKQPFGVNRAPLLSGLDSATGTIEVPIAVDKNTGAIITESGSTGGDTVNIIQFGGANVSLGQVAKATSMPVTLASDQNNALETGGNLATIATNTSVLSTSANQTNGTQQAKITDGTNIVNVLKSDGTIAGQNAQLTAGTGYTTATLTLNSGSPNTAWFDMINYAWWSVEILTNTTPATLTFQTSGDASETNVSSTSGFISAATNSTGTVTSTSSASATYHGPRTGRYFRISSNNGAGTTTLVITFFTNASVMNTYGGITVGSSSATASAVPANAFFVGVKDSGGNLNSPRALSDNADGSAVTAGGNLLNVVNRNSVFNGTSWDRMYSGGITGMAGVSLQASPSGGYSFLHIAAGQATTTVKSGAGTLHAIVFNGAATATNTTTIYDNTAASGTLIGIPAATAVTTPETVIYDLAFATGLTIITAAANGADMTVVYK